MRERAVCRRLMRGGGVEAIVALVGQVLSAREVGRFAKERGARLELAARQRETLEVLVVLEHVIPEVVLAEDADAVEVALGEILERALLAERQEHLVAVERSLALALRLEAVGGGLEQVHALDGRTPARAAIAEPMARAPEIEVNEPARIEVVAEPDVVREALPQHPRRAIVAVVLELDRRVPAPSRLLVRRRGLAPIARRDVAAREVGRHLLGQPERSVDVAQKEMNRRGRARETHHEERLAHQPQVPGQLFVDEMAAVDERPEVGQRLDGLFGVERRRRSSIRLSLVERRHG